METRCIQFLRGLDAPHHDAIISNRTFLKPVLSYERRNEYEQSESANLGDVISKESKITQVFRIFGT